MSDKIKRLKSPPYPSLSLPNALEKANELLAVAQGFAVPVATAAKAWGYSQTSSSITSVIGALNQFGLLEEEGGGASRRIKVSSLGEAIIKDRRLDSAQRIDAIRRAALMPKIFAELWSRYNTTSVDDSTIHYDLTLGRKAEGKAPYSEGAALDVAKKFRETFEFADFEESAETNVGAAQSDLQPSALKNESAQFWTDVDGRRGEEELRGAETDVAIRSNDQKKEVFATEDGDVILVWPSEISMHTYEDVDDWLKIVLRKMKRAASN